MHSSLMFPDEISGWFDISSLAARQCYQDPTLSIGPAQCGVILQAIVARHQQLRAGCLSAAAERCSLKGKVPTI